MKKYLTSTSPRRFNKFPAAFACLISLTFLWCAVNQQPTSAGDRGPVIESVTPVDGSFNESALFLAGKELSKTSPINAYSLKNEYLTYRKRMDASWARLQEANQKKIEQWKASHLPSQYTSTIFYPFSGPDIINALIFFPNGTDYIMFGLESPGEIPRPQNLPQGSLNAGLSGLSAALNNVLNVNYFKTVEMEKGVSTNSFNSITSVIMCFLARMDYDVLNVKKIRIDANSRLTDAAPARKGGKMISGIELLFRKGTSGPVKRVRYFQLNVIDNSLNTYTNFIPFLETCGRYTTILKSASYLMHNENKFIKIRDLTLSHSDYILQDDSGVALRYFDRNVWKLSFHGTYSRPVPLFAHRYQQDFMDAMKKNSTGPLPFSYGYNFKENESNLMFAERIKK